MMPPMRYLHEKTGIVLRLALLCLVLSAQALAHAHELDHIGRPDSTQCAICSVSASLAGPVHVEHEAWEPSPDLALRPVVTDIAIPLRQIARFTARAPPRSLQTP